MATKATLLFRNWPVKAASCYGACHGLFKASDGSILVIGRILPGPGAQTLVDQLPKVPASGVDDYTPLVAALAEMGAAVNVGQRIWRKTKPAAETQTPVSPETQAAVPETQAAVPETQAAVPETQASPDTGDTGACSNPT